VTDQKPAWQRQISWRAKTLIATAPQQIDDGV